MPEAVRPGVEEALPPVVKEALPPVVEEALPPVTAEVIPAEVEEALPPVVEEAGLPVAEESRLPVAEEAVSFEVDGAAIPGAEEAVWSEAAGILQPDAESELRALPSGKMPDRWSLLELRLWMEDSRRLSNETIEGVHSEIERILQVESALGKTAALAPVAERLAGIRAGIERRLDSLRERDGEWLKRITWVENLERISATWESLIETEESVAESIEAAVSETLTEPRAGATGSFDAAAPEAAVESRAGGAESIEAAVSETLFEPRESVIGSFDAAAPEAAVEPRESDIGSPAEGVEEVPPEREIAAPFPAPPHAAPTRSEDIYLFYYSGRPFALSASAVVKSRSVSRQTAKKILKRGYATLADVKPLFRSIRTGVSGRLATMSGKVLKSTEFAVIGPNYFQVAQAPPDPRMAIFVTTGSDYGVILADSEKVDFRAEAEIDFETCSCGAALGTVRTESGLCAEVLDIWRLFPDGEPAPVDS